MRFSMSPMQPLPARLFHSLEADVETRSGSLGKAPQRAQRRIGTAAFETRHGLLRSFHACSNIFLRQSRLAARVHQRGCEREFLFQRIVGAFVDGVPHPFFEAPLDRDEPLAHATSFARARAMFNAARGVRAVFLMKACSTTTRCPLAVTRYCRVQSSAFPIAF